MYIQSNARNSRRSARVRLGAPGRSALIVLALSAPVFAQREDFEYPPIRYSDASPKDAVAALGKTIERDGWSSDPKDQRAFLREVLERLEVPVESQVLVFSQTSFQLRAISPSTPRAVYFSDDCYVGWVQNGAIEVACSDPELGTTFYQLDPRGTKRPRFRRDNGCLSCHASGRTGRVPGLLVRSVYPDERGFPILSAGSFVTTDRSPLEERWGGWYVTGTHGSQRHMGNAIASRTSTSVEFDVDRGANQTSLAQYFWTEPYLVPTSDIVALMVLEHQLGVHNALVRANFKTRQALYRRSVLERTVGAADAPLDERDVRTKLGDEAVARHADDSLGGLRGVGRKIVEREADRVVERLLFAGEIKLRGGVRGGEGFEKAFLRTRRASSSGRSLRDFHLERRLFKHRCSFMIYSRAFAALPPVMKDLVYRRLWNVLTANELPEKFAHLGTKERTQIVEILRETKDGLPDYWYEAESPGNP